MFLMHRLQERSARDRFRHDATSWMHLVHRLASRTRGPASGCPAVVMVQPTHDRKSDHFAPCILRGRNRSVPFRNLLRHPLMRSCLVEVQHIRIEHALELPLLQDQQMVQAFLPHTSHEALTDGIGSWCVIRRLEHLNGTCGRYTSEAGPKFAIVITNQVLRSLPIRGGFSERYVPPRHRKGTRCRRHGSLVATSVR
jgi:hypothetical protein